MSYNHPEFHLLTALLLLHGLVKYDIQKDLVSILAHEVEWDQTSYIVATKNSENFSTPVELYKQPLVEVL